MSFQTFVTERLAAITSSLNGISTNAKKIDELPVQSSLDVSSKIHVSKAGVSESLEVQKIIEAVLSNNQNGLISIGSITISGNNITIPANALWNINNTNYTKSTDTIINIPFCQTGKVRTDLIIANNQNEILKIVGIEDVFAIAPSVSLNSVLITTIDVTDASVGNTQPPIDGNDFIKKDFLYGYNYPGLTGSDVIMTLMTQGFQRYTVTNSALVSVAGFVSSTSSVAEIPFENKPIRVTNKTGNPITLKHLFSVEFPFEFKDATDLIVPNNETVEFEMKISGGKKLVEVFRSFLNISGKEDTANKVDSITDNNTQNYPSNQAVIEYVETKVMQKVNVSDVYNALDCVVAGKVADARQLKVLKTAIDNLASGNTNFETTSQLNARDTNNRNRANHTGTQLASTISNFATTVLAGVLTGISFVTNSAVLSTDNILIAIGKLQAQITANQKLKIVVITGNTTISYATHNNAILLVKANATLILPLGMPTDFNCVVRSYDGVSTAFTLATGATFSAENDGKKLASKKMGTVLIDGANNYLLIGEFSV